MSYIDNITVFLLDGNKKLSTKATVVLFTILAILLVDNIIGFSYHYNTQRKIEEINNINSIINDSLTDKETKSNAIKLRSEIINRKNIISYTLLFIQNTKWTDDEIKNKKEIIVKENKNFNIEKIDLEIVNTNNFWFHLTSGGFFYILGIFMFPIMIFQDKTSSILQRIATGIFIAIILGLIGLFFYWICSLIPLISDYSLTWNYAINIIIQVGVLFVISLFGNKK